MGYVGVLMQSFKRGKRLYRQIRRDGMVAMYEVMDGGHISYEVFKIRQKKGVWVSVNGVKFKRNDGEAYPSPKEFGNLAYSCDSIERAEFRFKEIKAKLSARLN